MLGLIGRRGLPAGEGLLLCPAPSIHTAFMRFPIDALFLDRSLRVLDVVEGLRPWRVASKRRARAVLELPAGECARCGVEVGDRLELRDRKRVIVESPGAPASADAAATPEPDGASDARVRVDELARLQPLRVLVLSHDRQFRTVMSLLLGRRNCSVTATANASRLTELILRESPEVLLIDATELASGVTVAAVETLARPLGVVLVSDDAGSLPQDPPVLAKWGPFADLLAAIERADLRAAMEGRNGHRR
jgi:uncharacterized membrane protein (UPF0127 family)